MKSKLITVLIITSMMLISCNENNNSTNTKNVENSVSEFIIVDTDVSSSDEALQILKEGNAGLGNMTKRKKLLTDRVGGGW